MGANLKVQEMLHSRKRIAEELLHTIRSWDGTVESGIEIIEENQIKLEQLKRIQEEAIQVPQKYLVDEAYKSILELLLQEQKSLTQILKEKQNSLLQEMKQLNKKSKVMDSYISSNRPSIFVDKDFK